MKYFFSLLIFLLVSSGLLFAQFNNDDSEETRIEQAKALAEEQAPGNGIEVQFPNSVRSVTHPLFVGVDDITIFTYMGNPATGEWLPAFDGVEVWGAAYDNINDKMYVNAGSTLYEWPIGGTVTSLGTIVDTAGATLSFVSLAFYNGTLYGTRNIANEAVYVIDPATLVATVFIDYTDADFDFGGLAVDPNTGEFYGTNDDSTPWGRGLFRINMDGSGTLIVAYPGGETDIDGLAISDASIAYFVTDQPGDIYVYDINGATFLTPITNPWTTSEVFCGAAWNMGIIPVELRSFSGSVNGSDVTLLWETATELNNSGFSIERKSGDAEFMQIGFVPGFGTTTEPKSYSFSDNNLHSGTYIYRLKQIDFNGTSEYSSEVEVDVLTPAEFALDQNYPNPFNPTTRITFSLAIDSKVTLKVFNLLGQEVATLLNDNMTAGVHNYDFDASGLNSGIYFYKIEASGSNGKDFVDVKKMILIK